jgi:TrmH family RNA methyltransferase
MITSENNERVKQVRALQARRQARRKAQRFVIEGVRLVREAVLVGITVEEVFYTPELAASPEGLELLDGLSGLGAMLLPVDERIMLAMSDTKTPQGILAVLPDVILPLPADPAYVLIIDGVSDPGNLGTIMRAAAAAGVPLMVTAGGTVDTTNPKVVRSAMGAHFRLPVQHLSWEGIASRFSNHAIFLASTGSGVPYYRIDWTQPCALIVSEEAHGASEQAQRCAHARVTIPMPGSMESLNVAMAASIMIFEMVRQHAVQAG